MRARNLVKGAEESARVQLRAYVGLKNYGIQGIETADSIGVGFAFINYGQTPAIEFNLVGAVDYLPWPLPRDYTIPDPPPRQRQDAVIFPGQSDNPLTGFVWDRGFITTAQKQNAISQNPTHQIYAHGVATYRDVFGKRCETIFCLYLNHMSIKRDPSGRVISEPNGHINFQLAPVEGRNRIT